MRTERNHNANTFVIPPGYTDLGWQINPDHPQKVACRADKHVTKEYDNSLYRFRCTDVITICDDCKYVHHTDMSD